MTKLVDLVQRIVRLTEADGGQMPVAINVSEKDWSDIEDELKLKDACHYSSLVNVKNFIVAGVIILEAPEIKDA